MSSSAQHYPLEFAEIDGVVKEAFWALISRLTENQRQHPELYGKIEHELGWVDVTHFKSPEDSPSAEERWLHQFIRDIELSENGIPAKTYVIPFRGLLPGDVVYYDGIPPDFCSIRVNGAGAEPYSMMSLWNEHFFVQYFYFKQLSELPSVRRENLRQKLLHLIASTSSDPR